MNEEKRVLAFDFGASSGRAIVGIFDGNKITLQEVHRFANEPVTINGNIHWDVLRLFHEIKQGLFIANSLGGFKSVGIDTWGVDYCLIDKYGKLIGNPFHYRDTRTETMVEKALRFITADNLYSITGNQIMNINTAFQLMAEIEQRPYILENAKTLLLMPDFFNYLLTGIMSTEYSIASTTQLLNSERKEWSKEIFSRLDIKSSIFTEIVPAGTKIGNITEELCNEINIPSAEVISVCAHDTQSAVVAVPTQEKDFVFISCGTWSLFGTELDNPIINENSSRLNITNEGGFGGTTTFLKNIIGLWLIQETRRYLKANGKDVSYAKLESFALDSEAFKCFIDPDAPEFVPQGNIPKRVQEYCRRTGQPVPENIGEIMRCIYESLAMKYRLSLDEIKECTGKEYPAIYMLGGGTKDELLCQMTANACNIPVITGSTEATVLGNVAVQLIANGDIENISQARKIISNSSASKTFSAMETKSWNKAYEEFKEIVYLQTQKGL